jgi:hypothetical protein
MSIVKKIADYLLSGNANGMITKGTIEFSNVQPEDGGMFTRIDEEGRLYGHRVPNQDLEWSSTSNVDVTLSDTESLLVEVTVDHDVTSDNGSFLFKATIDNGSSSRDDNLSIIVRDGNDNAISSLPIRIDKGDTGYPATFYGSFKNNWPSGTTFRVYMISDQGSIVKGTRMPTGIKIVEAQAAPVNSFVESAADLGNSISRAEIVNSINESPKDLKIYIISDSNGHTWSCTYIKKIDKFAVKKLNLK